MKNKAATFARSEESRPAILLSFIQEQTSLRGQDRNLFTCDLVPAADTSVFKMQIAFRIIIVTHFGVVIKICPYN